MIGYAFYATVTVAYVLAALYAYKNGAPTTTTVISIMNASIMLLLPLANDELYPFSRSHIGIMASIMWLDLMALTGPLLKISMMRISIDLQKILYGMVELMMFPIFFTIATILYSVGVSRYNAPK